MLSGAGGGSGDADGAYGSRSHSCEVDRRLALLRQDPEQITTRWWPLLLTTLRGGRARASRDYRIKHACRSGLVAFRRAGGCSLIRAVRLFRVEAGGRFDEGDLRHRHNNHSRKSSPEPSTQP